MDVQSHYSITEIELLAIVWGMTKCSFYTKGALTLQYSVTTPRWPACTKKKLIKVENMRFDTMLERLADYSYDVHPLPGA